MVSDEDDYLGELEMEGEGRSGNGNWWGGGVADLYIHKVR